ncbi:MAG: TolC family protein [Pseudomonadota bacterium]
MSARLHARARTRTLCVLFSCLMMAAAVCPPAAAQGLGLGDLLARAASADPSAAINAARLQAAGAAVRGADFGPRPRVGIDLEDFAGSGPYRGADSSQTTAYYERVWERGGKREARVQLAQSEQAVARQRAQLRMLDLFEKVQTAWIEALAAQAAITIAQERLAAAERTERDVARRVSRAADPLFAGERARAGLAQARIARDQAIETARVARANLATWWGGDDTIALDQRAFLELKNTQAAENSTPDLDLLAAERDAANAGIRLAEAASATDPTLRVGVRRFGQGNEVALMVGGSIPIGLDQSSLPAIERAQAERLAAEGELAAARLQRKRDSEKLRSERAAILNEVARIDAEVIPLAERAAALVRDGFNRGGTAFTYLEVAEAQRALAEARTRRNDLARRFHLDGARLDRLSGRHLSLISSEEKR